MQGLVPSCAVPTLKGVRVYTNSRKIHSHIIFLKTFVLAWVGSVSVGVMYLFGPITSGLSERYGCKVVAFLGGLLCFLGLLLTSFVSDLSKLYMTYGVLWGIGSSFCYFPTLTAPGEYFCQRLSLVNGIVTAGKSFVEFMFQSDQQ